MAQALVVVSADRQYGVSRDQGATWTLDTLPAGVTAGPSFLAYGNGVWVALSNSHGDVAAVNIGGDWQAVTLPIASTWTSVLFFNGQFYAFSDSTTTYLASANGLTWNQHTGPTGVSRAVSSGAVLCAFVYSYGAPTRINRSADGVNWAAYYPALGNVNDLFWNGSLFVAVGANDETASSADGMTWDVASVPGLGSAWLRGGGDAARSLLVEQNTGNLVTSPSAALSWSASTLDAGLLPDGSPPTWKRVAAHAGRLFLSADHAILYSDDGVTWLAAQAAGSPLPQSLWSEIASGELAEGVQWFNSPLNITDSLTGTVSVTASTQDNLSLSSTLTLSLLLSQDVFDSLLLSDLLRASQSLSADLISVLSLSTEAVAISADGHALTRYQGFGFDGYARCGQSLYGVKANGLYRIRGGDDDGVPIDVQIDLGDSDFGSAQGKRLEAVYLGLSTDGEAYVRLRAGDREHTYRAIQKGEMARAVPGKGLDGRRWTIALEITDATALTLDAVEVRLGASARRLRGRN
jgi:hypothetical protein